MSLADLEKALGVSFQNTGLLQQALVHRSFVNEQGGVPQESYERMEFLGDAVLELVVSTELYHLRTDLSEGELTKARSALVRREALAAVARRLELGRRLLLGKGEESTGGRERDSTLSAAFEAVVAALYLDRGYDEARQFILRVLAPELAVALSQGVPPQDPKSRLQEVLQGQGRHSPRYQVVASQGPDHSPLFTVEVMVENESLGTGQGGKKADAERAAAAEALRLLVQYSEQE